MASTKKNQAAGKKTGKTRRNQTPVSEPQDSFFGAEAAVIISFALAVFLFLSNFHLCGVAGDAARSVQLGLFGLLGFVFPLFLFVGTAFYMSNRGNAAAFRKLLAAIVLLLVLCAFLQMFASQPMEGEGMFTFYRLSAENGAGGGLAGGALSTALRAVLGTAGTFLVLIVGIILCGVCITERSFVGAVKRRGGRVYEYAREDLDRRKELHAGRAAARDEERKRRREEKLRGVNLSSTDLSLDVDLLEKTAGMAASEIPAAASEKQAAPKAGKKKNPAQDAVQADVSRKDVSRSGTFRADRGADASKSGETKKQESVVAQFPDPADVFVGEITPPQPSVQENSEVPFEEDPVLRLSAEESAQRLVEQGSRFLNDADLTFAARAEAGSAADPVFRKAAAEDLPAEEPVPAHVSPNGFSEPEKAAGTVSRKQEEPASSVFVSMDEEEIYMPEPEDVPLSTSVPYIPPTAEDDPLPEEPKPAAAFSTAEEIPARTQEAPSASPPPAYPGLDVSEKNSVSPSAEIPIARDGVGVTERYEQQLPDEDGYLKKTESGGVFYVPGGTKRVETASGKIIETDTETLQKKLESRRKQVKEESGEAGVAEEIKEKEEAPKREYVFPSTALLKKPELPVNRSDQEYRDTAVKLQQTLKTFGVGVTVTNISCGPSVTRYELHPEMGVKVSRIVGLADDIKLSLAAADIRIEAPIPGKSAVGIEVPNKENNTVYLRELLEADNFKNHASRLAFAVGKDIGGQVVVADIAKMPHLLIAGATGSGKSVCINTLIMSIIYKARPEDVKLILVDPKVVELSVYNGVPHLLIPVVTDPKKAAGALNWAVAEMTDRYKKFAKYGVRDLKGFNARVDNISNLDDPDKPVKMPQIVIIIDELADLMMVASGEVEDAICRLAQLARACGIHLVIATQRPSVNVITGLIKANVPSRIAFSVSSGVDSRTILDMNGAEKLLGKGDMLFYPAGYPKPQRVQGAFVSDSEVQAVVDFLKEQGMGTGYNAEVEKQLAAAPEAQGASKSSRDELFAEAGRFIIEKDKASIGMLQRMFKIGFNRAARIMDQLSEAGVVGPEEGTKPRKILMTQAEFEEFLSYGE